jgi:hypothetical protein
MAAAGAKSGKNKKTIKATDVTKSLSQSKKSQHTRQPTTTTVIINYGGAAAAAEGEEG